MIEGNAHHRILNPDSYYDKERKYLSEFEKMVNTGFNINYFGGIEERGTWPLRYLTEEEQKIVVTVIQWLGTPVGNQLIKDVEGL